MRGGLAALGAGRHQRKRLRRRLSSAGRRSAATVEPAPEGASLAANPFPETDEPRLPAIGDADEPAVPLGPIETSGTDGMAAAGTGHAARFLTLFVDSYAARKCKNVVQASSSSGNQ